MVTRAGDVLVDHAIAFAEMHRAFYQQQLQFLVGIIRRIIS